MDKIKLAIIIISCIVALFTLLIGVKQPTMHKQAMFTDEYHEFVEEDIPTSNVSLSNTNIPTTNTIKNDNVTTLPQRKRIVKQIIRYTEPTNNSVTQQQKTVQKPTTKQTTQHKTQTNVNTPVQKTNNNYKIGRAHV